MSSPPASAMPPFFISDGEGFVATESTRGPWSRQHQHGGPPAALLARAMEQLAGDGALLTRLTFDFLRRSVSSAMPCLHPLRCVVLATLPRA